MIVELTVGYMRSRANRDVILAQGIVQVAVDSSVAIQIKNRGENIDSSILKAGFGASLGQSKGLLMIKIFPLLCFIQDGHPVEHRE